MGIANEEKATMEYDAWLLSKFKESEDRRDRFNEMCDRYRELEEALKNEIEALKDALHDSENTIQYLKEKAIKLEEENKSLRTKNTTMRFRENWQAHNPKEESKPIYIENLNVTYYANGPFWTEEDDICE